MSLASKKVPIAVVSGILCLILGVVAGVGGMVALGYTDPQAAAKPTDDNTGQGGPAGGGLKGGPKGKDGGPAGPGPKGGPKGKDGGGPGPKIQLAQLVNKLDVLTNKDKPLVVKLDDKQKKEVKELLNELNAKDDLTDDEAKAKLEDLMKIVGTLPENKDALETLGTRRGGGGGGKGPTRAEPLNPLKSEPNAAHLKQLLTTLGQ